MVATVFSLILLGSIALLFGLERAFPRAISRLEENILAGLLAFITLLSFTQVVLRYSFSTNLDGGLELTTVVFAWLILFGMSYGIKNGMHLGVDAFIRMLPARAFRFVSIFGALCCVLYGAILLDADWLKWFGASTRGGGALDYWAKFYKLGIGMEDMRYPAIFVEYFDAPERIQRWVAYLMLPVGLALLIFRSLQAAVDIAMGTRELIIASHESEELVAENKGILAD